MQAVLESATEEEGAMRASVLDGQMTFALFDERPPTWEDVQKGSARTVVHGAYARPCTSECMWAADVADGTCYLFRAPVADGMCPSTTHLERTPDMVESPRTEGDA